MDHIYSMIVLRCFFYILAAAKCINFHYTENRRQDILQKSTFFVPRKLYGMQRHEGE